jgi:hypothetical protein
VARAWQRESAGQQEIVTVNRRLRRWQTVQTCAGGGGVVAAHVSNIDEIDKISRKSDNPSITRDVSRGRAAGRELSRVDRDALPRFSRPTQSGQSGQSGVSGGSAAGRVSWAVLSSIDAAQWISHDTLPQLPHWACRLAGLVAKKMARHSRPSARAVGFSRRPRASFTVDMTSTERQGHRMTMRPPRGRGPPHLFPFEG